MAEQTMRNIKKRQTKFVAAAIGMIMMAIAASRQLYLFVVFRNAEGLLGTQGGRYHLWLAIGAVLMACIAGCFMFFFFLRYGAKGNELRAS
jgi:hypothetical protein